MTSAYAYRKMHHEPCDPAFTVHVYQVGRDADPTIEALRDMGQHAYIFNVEEDPVAHHYVTDVLDHYSWPVVTITHGADLLAHWEGYREDMLALIPALRARHKGQAA